MKQASGFSLQRTNLEEACWLLTLLGGFQEPGRTIA